jgi:hypothetical protein
MNPALVEGFGKFNGIIIDADSVFSEKGSILLTASG